MSVKNLSSILLAFFAIFGGVFLYFIFFGNPRSPNTRLGRGSSVDTALKKITDTPQNSFSLILTGDIMLGRNVRNQSVRANDFFYPFRNVSENLKNSDIVLSNLESPAVSNCPVINEGYVFCSPEESLDALKRSGVNVVSLANNHSLNFGKEGFSETKSFLDERGILFTGDSGLTVKQINGFNIGFLGFDFTVNEPGEKDYALVERSNRETDILIVAVHWGVEYEDAPRDFQRVWAKEIVRRGADLIAGNHPHWVQGAECFENGESIGYTEADNLEDFECFGGKTPVYYSLGNFIFDQMWSEETKKGAIIKLFFKNGKITEQKVIRTYIRNSGQPEFLDYSITAFKKTASVSSRMN